MPVRTRSDVRVNQQRNKDSLTITSDVYGSFRGRVFGSWIDADGRNNGYNEGGLVENPAYIIESIWRDELGLGSTMIDYASVDAIGNTTNGKRKDWIFGRSLTSVEHSTKIIQQLLHEAHCIAVKKTLGQRRLLALDADAATPFVIERNQMSRKPLWSWSHQSFIYNQFVFGYDYDYSGDNYRKTIVVDESRSTLADNTFAPSSFTPDEDAGVVKYGDGALTSLCGVSQSRFGVKRRLEENWDWIYDDTTANFLAKKIIEWRYAPHLVVDVLGWWGDQASSSRKPLIAYEPGDQCYIDHPLLDNGITNAYVFMVVSKIIYKNERLVKLNLISMR